MAPGISDHAPCCITFETPLQTAGTRPFKFFNFLTEHPDFLETLINSWNVTPTEDHSLNSLSIKQKGIKNALKTLHKDNFSDIQKRVLDATKLYQTAQEASLIQPTSSNLINERNYADQLSILRRIEEAYFKQKSRINWLQTDDQNTSYFQKVAKARNSYNIIHTLIGLDGVEASTPADIGTLAASHFQGILGPPILPRDQRIFPPLYSILRSTCPLDDVPLMSRCPTSEEITDIMFKLNPNKSPGPDGLTYGFYKASWSFVGEEVIRSISRFFSYPFMPFATNATILTLVPKFPGATIVKDYRPISCCNTIYKVISKLLVTKLKPILPSIILPNQTAFIKGRKLLENCMLASELVNGYHKNKGPKRLTLKVDIAKTFDSIR